MDGISTGRPHQASRDKIWVLEDDADIGYILEVFLNDEGYETVLLTTTEKFRTAMETGLPDLFLMDVMLPDGDGVDLCIELKNNDRFSHIPVLMMSAHASLKRVNDCQPDGFITKPFDLMEVLQSVQQQLGSA